MIGIFELVDFEKQKYSITQLAFLHGQSKAKICKNLNTTLTATSGCSYFVRIYNYLSTTVAYQNTHFVEENTIHTVLTKFDKKTELRSHHFCRKRTRTLTSDRKTRAKI